MPGQNKLIPYASVKCILITIQSQKISIHTRTHKHRHRQRYHTHTHARTHARTHTRTHTQGNHLFTNIATNQAAAQPIKCHWVLYVRDPYLFRYRKSALKQVLCKCVICCTHTILVSSSSLWLQIIHFIAIIQRLHTLIVY